MTENEPQQNASPKPSGAEVARWADVAMYRSEPIQASEGPKATLLSGPADPLGLIAAQAKTYVGEFVDDLSDVTDDERRHYLAEMQKTALAMPLEAVMLNFSLTGVTRSFTHQMVRQRTAAYAQESLRFSVIEDDFAGRVALPPSLEGAKSMYYWDAEAMAQVDSSGRHFITDNDRDVEIDAVRDSLVERYGTDVDKARYEWEKAIRVTQGAYRKLVNSGIPAEDARGLLPHSITTRIKYNTNLRNLLEHIGLRTCTQAQFEWRGVAFQMMQALRAYGMGTRYRVNRGGIIHSASSQWQYEALAGLFSPICYRKGNCVMQASFDRKCSIRERVEFNASVNRPSTEWHLPLFAAKGDNHEMIQIAGPIMPQEWMLDPSAAR